MKTRGIQTLGSTVNRSGKKRKSFYQIDLTIIKMKDNLLMYILINFSQITILTNLYVSLRGEAMPVTNSGMKNLHHSNTGTQSQLIVHRIWVTIKGSLFMTFTKLNKNTDSQTIIRFPLIK